MSMTLTPDGAKEILANGSTIDCDLAVQVSSGKLYLYLTKGESALARLTDPIPVGADGSFMIAGLKIKLER